MPFRWNDPSSWSIPIYLWLAFMLLGWIVPLWRWLQRRRAAAWPVVGGRIESADWSKPAFSLTIRRGYYAARLGYSYSVAGTCYSGQYKQEFPTDKEAQDFIRDLQDQHITVHYNPNSPGSSTLLASDIDVVLQHRAPSPEGESPLPAESIPDWLRPFIWIFIALSELGLVVSVWVHLAGVMGKRAAPMPFFFLLHVGIFVVFIPALLISQRQVGNVNRKDFWKVVLKSSPDWMRYMVYFLFAYAAVNFLLYMTTVGFGHAGDPTAQDWRGFSGHWMVFYSASLAILYSAARGMANVPRCLNGHPGTPGLSTATAADSR